ncbi:SUMF1/EgtB/PvdO family nonheme iron enzyme [Neptunomonas sp. XY-337]|uniref:SUMF1/EgtB/PvdO family nonheme iron enzyme n=1 Tax=Neptunomonas sp. XY-337 TaxID=2561897 RepID=UPI0010AAC1D3|nr:SUMF1/EgtB/PvdO family nonheme iron enzyme [Neptunomonas sp. XY-337]
MSSQHNSPLNQLSDGLIIGPEHHRFKLVGSAVSHPLGQRWDAEDMSTPKPTPVSLFVLNPQLIRSKPFLAEFKKQIIFAKNLKHKHIAQTFGYFVHKGGMLFFTTERFDGPTLQTLIDDKRSKKLKETQQRGLLLQLASATDALVQKLRDAHGALAPDLIYINRKGGVKILPINPRKLLKEVAVALEPPFMAAAYQPPEAYHENPLPLNADSYSIAAMVYATLTAAHPFSANDSEAERVQRRLKPLSKLGPKWSQLEASLSTLPEERAQSATALIEGLFEQDTTEETAEPSPDETDTHDSSVATETPSSQAAKKTAESEPKRSRRFSAIGLGIAFGLGAVAGLSVSFLLLSQQQAMMTDNINAWKAQAENWKARAQEHELAVAALQQSLAQAEQAAAAGAAPSSPGESNGLSTFRDELTVGGFGPHMVILPAGSFTMGDSAGKGDDNEKPTLTVTIEKPFALAKYEVTFAEYDQFAQATGRKLPADEGWGRGQQPVINVSWNDAQAYTQWLAAQTGQPYRLPSEAEWEYAARAGTTTAYWWGDELSSAHAVCDGCGTQWDGKQPAPVGSVKESPWGLHDMSGNVDEWVQDCYTSSYNGHPTDGSARLSGNCQSRVMRGGSWFDIDRVIRPASRYRHPLNATRNTWGFRVALDTSN